MSILSVVEWVVWGIILAFGLWFAIGIRTAAVRHAPPPLWPTLIISFSLVFLPLLFLFLPFSKLHIIWILLILWQISFMAGVRYIPLISKLLIWPAYIYACILIMGTGASLGSPSRYSPWAARQPKQWPWLTNKIQKNTQNLSNGGRLDNTEKDYVNFLYEKLWRESLCEIMPETTAKEIATELLIPDKIDGFAFAHNYSTFLRRGFPPAESFLFPDKVKNPCTASIMEASRPSNYILSFPDWFIAAYPDVFMWFSSEQRQRVRNRKGDEDIADVMTSLVYELFKINPENKKLQATDLYDSDKKWLPKWLKNLVSSYKQETGKIPEASVDETKDSLAKEIYHRKEIQ
ncbi:MAG: hypothetical protein WCZ89_07240 [Phycisphaerae bacterium]